MTLYRILQYPDPKLKRKAHHVTAIDDRITTIIDNMFETHYNAQNCAALAATQLDMPDPPHITVIDFSDKKDTPFCLVNGEIIESSGEMHEEEACMSIMNVYEKIKRATHIKVRALDRHGKPLEFEVDGFMAKCIQHELDHLNGKIFIDRLSPLKRSRVDTKFMKWLRQQKL